MDKYDIFISYRRSSYDTPNLIATRLKAAGYRVFFDVESMRSGKFNEQLYEVIEKCNDVIVVLPPEALERCHNEGDWVREEILHAMKNKKNIIPVMLNGFTWPNPMPKGMEELCNYQALTASSVEYFDLAMEKLQKRYLLSKRHLPIRKLIKYTSIIISALLALVAIIFGVFMILSRDVCKKYATSLTMDASYVHIIAEENHKLKKSWNTFNNAIEYEYREERIVALQEDMLSRIDLVERNIKQGWQVDSIPMEINAYHGFLLSLNGINAEEIAISPSFATLYYTDYMNQLNTMRNAVRTLGEYERRFSTVLFEILEHSINSYFISTLCELSEFPKYSRSVYNALSKEWIHFPIQYYKIDEEREYYENCMMTESKLANEILSHYQSTLEKVDAELDDIQKRNDELERKMIDGFAQLEARADTISTVIQTNAEINRFRQEKQQERAIREEKIKAKEIAVNALKAELLEVDNQYVQIYEQLKEKCTLEEEDSQWHKWGKIRRWGTYLAMLTKSRLDMLSIGIHSISSITPEVAYADMNSMLMVYKTYHPESEEYVVSAKQFFRELSKGKRKYAGVIIYTFKEGTTHPFFQKGDIIIGYDGKDIKNHDELKIAYKKNKNGVVTYQRLINGEFEEYKKPLIETDIVGFLDLTE